ncbi:alpha/beta-hydrolase [Dentipellis sp. KUC8613]|nr:alpha/beta-hydrolase [Dentipellis sp. KUC8613]
MSQYAHLSVPDPEFAAASANFPIFAPTRDIEVLRKALRDGVAYFNEVAKNLLPADSEYREEEHQIPVDGGEITVRCFTPTPGGEDGGGPYPLLVNFHGGGWSTGGLFTDDTYLRHLCVAHKVSIVNVDYRLAPEHPHPIPRNDCYAGLKWAADHATLLNASPAKGFIIHGASSGANLAADATHRAKNDPFFQGRPLTGQVLQFPVVIHVDYIPEKYKSEIFSFEENAENLTLPASAMRYFYEIYGADPKDEDVYTLLKPDHKGLPPAVIQICGQDPLRDEGILYDKVLREAGVKTKLNIYPGVPHAFILAFPQIKQGQKYIKEVKAGLQWLLDGAP